MKNYSTTKLAKKDTNISSQKFGINWQIRLVAFSGEVQVRILERMECKINRRIDAASTRWQSLYQSVVVKLSADRSIFLPSPMITNFRQ